MERLVRDVSLRRHSVEIPTPAVIDLIQNQPRHSFLAVGYGRAALEVETISPSQVGALLEVVVDSGIEPRVGELAESANVGKGGVQRQAGAVRHYGGLGAVSSLRLHWPEYLMETGEMTAYLFSACAFATLLQHPASPVRQSITSGAFRRGFLGLAIGATIIAILMSPWGQQSGGHLNPAVTFTFYRLGKVSRWDTLFYAVAQFLGAVGGVEIATYMLRGAPRSDAVHYAVTMPGVYGVAGAFLGELTISFILMTTILFTTNRETLARYTPYFVGALYAIFISIEAPLSGMSMNPARTFGSAFPAGYWHALWIYFIAPTLGMLVAAELFLRIRRGVPPYCAKLHHANKKRCIFQHGPVVPH